MHVSLALILSLAAAAVAMSHHGECLTVGQNNKAQYSTIQGAVNAVKPGVDCIFIHRGIYPEQVKIEKLQTPLAIFGETDKKFTYKSNNVTITYGLHVKGTRLTNEETATLYVAIKDFKLYNVNVVNSSPEGSEQALALAAMRERQGYYGCSFIGIQDTVLSRKGAQIFNRCNIRGRTDFIYGREGFLWLHQCDIRVLNGDNPYITANGAKYAGASRFVLNRCDIRSFDESSTLDRGKTYLGRPWGPYAATTVQFCDLTDIINPLGWSPWSKDSTKNVRFEEYGNSGRGRKIDGRKIDGRKIDRAAFSRAIPGPVRIEEILGPDFKQWVDTRFSYNE